MLIKLNLLLSNPIIQTYSHAPLNSQILNECLGLNLTIPNIVDIPFLFSCFALSIDGKLCYRNNPSGFSIASSNHHATDTERKADLQTLMIARSMSNAVILGSDSLHSEKKTYISEITIPELSNLRTSNKSLSKNLWNILICRNLGKIDGSYSLFNDTKTPLIICCFNQVNSIPDNLSNLDNFDIFKVLKLSNLDSIKQLGLKNILEVDVGTKKMFQIFKQIGFNIILNESPFFHHLLLEKKLLHEIWLNYACSYIGGNINSLGYKQSSFSTTNHPDTEILTLHHLNYNFLYSRQRVLNSTQHATTSIL